MEESVVARVNYFDRQFLRTQDFVDDQAYYLAMQRRHRIAEHIWGIVAGLAIELDKDQKVIIQPGIAIDGYGRESVLRQGVTVLPKLFDEQSTDVSGGLASLSPGRHGSSRRRLRQLQLGYVLSLSLGGKRSGGAAGAQPGRRARPPGSPLAAASVA